MNQYNIHFNTRSTPQTEAIPGSTQVANSAGGYSWAVDDWTRLKRFLILGSEGGSYYASEPKLTKENAEAVLRCIQANGKRAVEEIVCISEGGRAPKNDPALFALAMCAGLGDTPTRKLALAFLPKVARIGTHLFHFCSYVESFRGWGRSLRGGVADWYNTMDAPRLAEQLVKYRSRDGWSHRDVLRLAHPKTVNETYNGLYQWATKGWEAIGEAPHPDTVLRTLWAYERAQKATSGRECAKLMQDYALPMECIPTNLRTAEVYDAALETNGLTWLFRNLGNLSKCGLLKQGAYDVIERVTCKLNDPEGLKRGRIHPLQALTSLMIYKQGHGEKSDATWPVVPDVVDALDSAFYIAFGAVPVTGKRWVLALDVSGSMASSYIAGMSFLSARMASAAMAMVTYKVEPKVSLIAFSDGRQGGGMWGQQACVCGIDISRLQRLDDVVRGISNLNFGGTDCALPMLWALHNHVEADVFVILTDSETWAGQIHPMQALRQYREKTGIAARLITVGMTSNGFTIGDPQDAGSMDVVGFDTATPQIMADFAKGDI